MARLSGTSAVTDAIAPAVVAKAAQQHGASLPLVGFGAKKLSDALTASRVAQLRATIAAGGRAPMTFNPAPGTSAITNAIARAVAANATQAQN
jgi:hypothetical protein